MLGVSIKIYAGTIKRSTRFLGGFTRHSQVFVVCSLSASYSFEDQTSLVRGLIKMESRFLAATSLGY